MLIFTWCHLYHIFLHNGKISLFSVSFFSRGWSCFYLRSPTTNPYLFSYLHVISHPGIMNQQTRTFLTVLLHPHKATHHCIPSHTFAKRQISKHTHTMAHCDLRAIKIYHSSSTYSAPTQDVDSWINWGLMNKLWINCPYSPSMQRAEAWSSWTLLRLKRRAEEREQCV